MRTRTLASGHEMPMLGLGTWEITKPQVLRAIELGYRHIDTAWAYRNQEFIGESVRECGLDRNYLFITSKAWHFWLDYDGVQRQFDDTMDQLGLDYVDLYLVHWPNDAVPIAETLRAFEEIVAERRARSIGVANFDVPRLQAAMSATSIPMAVNQFRFNPHHFPEDALEFCDRSDVVVTAYTPLELGAVGEDTVLQDIGRRHGKTPGQVALRWIVQKGVVVIPKAGSEHHQRENMDIFDWNLSNVEVRRIDALGRVSGRNVTPDWRPDL